MRKIQPEHRIAHHFIRRRVKTQCLDKWSRTSIGEIHIALRITQKTGIIYKDCPVGNIVPVKLSSSGNQTTHSLWLTWRCLRFNSCFGITNNNYKLIKSDCPAGQAVKALCSCQCIPGGPTLLLSEMVCGHTVKQVCFLRVVRF